MKTISITKYCLIVITAMFLMVSFSAHIFAAEESGSVGIEGTISAPPPTQAATIALPNDGQTITEVPITVSGLCPDDVNVRIYKNDVFAGATQCENGSYSVQIDLFAGRNELVARVFDDLNQSGPDSNTVVVNFPVQGSSAGDRISLSSAFAKRGSNPNDTLTWPIILSGGNGPYAITVDWGDGKEPDVLTREFPGTFNTDHVYDNPGIYTVIVKAVDADDNAAFLQLIGVSNGEAAQNAGAAGDDSPSGPVSTRILWQPALVFIPLLLSTFWLGKRHELHVLRKRLEQK